MRTARKQAIRHALFRRSLHTPPKGIIDALAQQGVLVDEELVRQVPIELLKEATRGRIAVVPMLNLGVRRRPKWSHGKRAQRDRKGGRR
jgi:hypothetical protein